VDVRGGAGLGRGLPKPLFDVRITPNTANDVGADGRFLIPVPEEQPGSEQVHVVVNWTATLKK
jgi:hypothetical protein